MNPMDIHVSHDRRREMGWLDALERSIEAQGLLQPIGVDAQGTLLFGARRLQACKNLGWEDVPARIIDIDADDPAAALKVERDENEVRKDFTPSEKVAIAQRIEEALSGRHGGARGKRLPLAEGEPQGKSTDLAASAVGWSGEQYRQAKHVMEEADDETKEAVDSGAVSVNKAYRKTRGRSAPKAITVRLAYDVEPDANVIIAKSGGEYATRLAMKILELEGHEVKHVE